MKFKRYVPVFVLLGVLGGCGDRSQKEETAAPETPAPTESTAAAPVSPVVAGSGDAAALYEGTCAACHGTTGEGVGDFPALTALSRDVVLSRLEAYRAGETVGPRSAVMAPLAKQLSDEQIEALATYLGS